ncbi:MAG: peptidoglycan-binding protein LysM [Geminicoccaceae bacterium]
MGLWSFIKEAGHKIGIGKAEAAQPEGSPPVPPPGADAIKSWVKDLGLDVKDLDVAVEGDKVVLKGEAPDQATKEKVILAAGNIAGVAKVEETVTTAVPAAAQTAATSAQAESVFYTVKKGDTLWAIAKAQYGEGGKYPAIFEANRPMLKHPDKIFPGQTLRIPPEPA